MADEEAPKRRDAKFAEEGGPKITPRRVPGQTGMSFEQKQMVDFVRTSTRKNIWYYRDRMNVSRGPCTLPVLRECWVQGIIDENTLIWGQGLGDFIPVRNVRTLTAQIRTVEVQVATWIKKQFALKPALERVRKQRSEMRVGKSDQVDNMF